MTVADAIITRPGNPLARLIEATIPDTEDGLRSSMDDLGGWINDGGWATAAVVFAWTEPGQGRRTDLRANAHKLETPKEFASKGLRGLSDEHTVAFYRKAWAEAVDVVGDALPAVKGRPFPPIPMRDFPQRKLSTRELLEQNADNEWYTPQQYIESARAVLGGIDLDPASSDVANQAISARTIYTAEDSGLEHEWPGTVWLNPPYGGLVAKFAVKFREEYEAERMTAGILLVNSHPTETKWFQALLREYPVCFTNHRIDFTNAESEAGGSTHGSAFIYLGPEDDRFAAEFRQYGAVVWPL